MNDRLERRRILGHTVAGGMSTAWSAALTLALVAYLIRRLGQDEYGTWILLTIVTVQGRGLASLLDLGLQQSTIQRVASASEDERGAVVGAVLHVLTVVGTATACILLVAAPRIVTWFEIPPDLTADATFALRVLGLQLLFEIPGLAFASTLEGLRQYPLRRSIDAARVTIFCGAAMLAVSTGGGIRSLAITSAFSGAAFVAACAVACHHCGLRVSGGGSPTTELRAGLPLLSLRAAGVGSRQTDRIVLGAVLGTAAVATFDVADRVNQLSFVLLGVTTSALIPAATHALSIPSLNPRALLRSATAWSAAITLPTCAIAIALAEPLADVIGGSGIDHGATVAALRWLAVSTAMATTYAAGFEMAIGAGSAPRLAPLAVITLGVNVVATLLLVDRFGVAGAAAASAIATASILPAVATRVAAPFDSNARELVAAAIPGLVAAVAGGVGARLLYETTGVMPTIPRLVGAGLVGGLTAAAVIGTTFRRVPSALRPDPERAP